MAGAGADASAGPGGAWEGVFSSDTEDEAHAATKAEARVKKASGFKEEGNRLLQQGLVPEAVAAYKKAITAVWALYRRAGDPVATSSGAAKLGAAVDLNLALCHIKLGEWEAAHKSANRALAADPGNAKGLYRRGLAGARLDLYDAAEEDLTAALRLQPTDPEIRRELDRAKERRATVKGEHGGAVPKGFLQAAAVTGGGATEAGAAATATSACEPDLSGPGAAHSVGAEPEEQAEAVAEEPQWVFASQVQEALEEVNAYLLAITSRRVVCDSEEQLRGLLRQTELAARLLPQARKVVEASLIEPPDPAEELSGLGTLEVADLLERMAAGLAAMCPGLRQLEKRPGELDNIRVCRELCAGEARGSWRGFDVEMVRWGDAGPPTPDNFAEPLFPPTGRPPDAGAAAWQREVFHRFCLRGSGELAAAAAWTVLSSLFRRGVPLEHRGRPVAAVGLARGLFFAGPVPQGPEPTGTPSAAALRADALAICSGQDRRLVMLPSFTSLGVPHAWLLVRLADGGGAGVEGEAEAGGEEMALDLCAGAIGLLPGSSLVRLWSPPSADGRFLQRCAAEGAAAAALARACSAAGAAGRPGAPWAEERQREVLAAMLVAAGLPQGALEAFAAPPDANAAAPEVDDLAFRREAARRLAKAATSLGLPCSLDASAADGEVPTQTALEAAQAAAAQELVRRKLRAAGLTRLADCAAA